MNYINNTTRGINVN